MGCTCVHDSAEYHRTHDSGQSQGLHTYVTLLLTSILCVLSTNTTSVRSSQTMPAEPLLPTDFIQKAGELTHLEES